MDIETEIRLMKIMDIIVICEIAVIIIGFIIYYFLEIVPLFLQIAGYVFFIIFWFIGELLDITPDPLIWKNEEEAKELLKERRKISHR